MTSAKQMFRKGAAVCALALVFLAYTRSRDPRDELGPATPRRDLAVTLTDAFGRAVKTDVTVEICHPALDECRRQEIPAPVSGDVIIPALPAGLSDPYTLKIGAPSYNGHERKIHVPAAGPLPAERVALHISPKSVARVGFPAYADLPETWRALLERSGNVRGHAGRAGQALYEHLETLHRAALLNIMAKMSATALADGTPLLAQMAEIAAVMPDRVLMKAAPGIEDKIAAGIPGGLVYKVGFIRGGLHTPPLGYGRAGSFKSYEDRGNININLYRRGGARLAEIDIDEGTGWLHLYEIIRNGLLNRDTSPYKIAQVLYAKQGIDPLYRIDIDSPAGKGPRP